MYNFQKYQISAQKYLMENIKDVYYIFEIKMTGKIWRCFKKDSKKSLSNLKIFT